MVDCVWYEFGILERYKGRIEYKLICKRQSRTSLANGRLIDTEGTRDTGRKNNGALQSEYVSNFSNRDMYVSVW